MNFEDNHKNVKEILIDSRYDKNILKFIAERICGEFSYTVWSNNHSNQTLKQSINEKCKLEATETQFLLKEKMNRYEKIGVPNESKNLELINVWAKLEHPEYIFDEKVCLIPEFKYWL